MGFLDRLNTPSYGINGNRQYAYTPVGREDLEAMRPIDPTPPMHFGPDDPDAFRRVAESARGRRGIFGPVSQGVIDRVGSGGNPTAGLLGIQNTTGFSQEAPNVVYDQGPEQFAKELALKKRELDIQEKQADASIADLSQRRDIEAERNRIAYGRNDIAMFKAQNPNMILKASAGGNYFAIDPQTGETMDTGIPVGNMTQEGALNLHNQGQMNLQGLRNEGSMATTQARNQAMIEALGLRNASAETLEGLRQSGMLDRLMRSLEGTKNNTIYKEGQSTYRNKLKEGLINPEDPVEGQAPQYPRGDINLPSAPTKPSGLNLGSGGLFNSPGVIGELGQSFQISPKQMQGFNAAPGQYTAKPGQYSAQSPAGKAAQANGERVIKMQAPDGRELDVPESEVNKLIAAGAKVVGNGGSTGQAAGQVSGTRAGQITPGTLPAGSVR